jgi:thiol-disulfide isomerase/thioredoxin
MSSGVYVVLGAVVVALVAGAVLALRNGRFRGTHAVRGAGVAAGRPPVSVLDGSPWEGQLGERVTLLQFSSAFCAPCRSTRRILSDVANRVPGVRHIEVDAEHHLDVVRRLSILRTPTTLVLDADGREVSRASGAPTRDQVLVAVSAAVSD